MRNLGTKVQQDLGRRGYLGIYGYITGLEGDGQIYTENWVIKAHRQFGIVMAGGVKMECSQSEVSKVKAPDFWGKLVVL